MSSHLGANVGSRLGRYAGVRYSLVLVLLWIGGMKFTAYEAAGISGFVANSPLMSWAYSLFSVRRLLGRAGHHGNRDRPAHCRAAALGIGAALVGSALAIGMFLTTLSFLLTTPGVW